MPSPPLVFDTPYVQLTPTDFANKGYAVYDSVGIVSIKSVEIVAPTIVKISLDRNTIGDVSVKYAEKAAYNGNGCLRDSDETIAPFNYEWIEGNGQYPSAQIESLIGKPYPLHNWGIAFSIIAEEV